jgi:predicted dithiol-disulfide oxidoreductase (DUF899 family)
MGSLYVVKKYHGLWSAAAPTPDCPCSWLVQGRQGREAAVEIESTKARSLGQSEEDQMGLTFPGESADYRVARDELLARERDLRRTLEEVAVARRALPPGGAVPEDYAFREMRDGRVCDVRLSGLFSPGRNSLAIYNFMFPRDPTDDRPGPATPRSKQLPLLEAPCPSCTALLDQLDGAVPHVSPLMSFAVVAKAPIERVAVFAEERGWRHLRLVSSSENTFNRDYHAESATGEQRPFLNVFHRVGSTVRHFWGSELFDEPTEPDQDPRHVGTLEPSWNLLDLTPEGRPTSWDEQFTYPE